MRCPGDWRPWCGRSAGVAGFFNLDVVRNPSLSKAPYIARLMWHQIVPLGHKTMTSERTPFSFFRELPERRLEIRFGKFSMADFFDLNTYGTRQQLPVHELDGRQQRCLRLCRGHSRVHLRSVGGVSRPQLCFAIRGSADAQSGQRDPSGRGPVSRTCGKHRTGAARTRRRKTAGRCAIVVVT